MSVAILILWSENYGDSKAKALHSFTDAMSAIRRGMIQAFKLFQRVAVSLRSLGNFFWGRGAGERNLQFQTVE